MTRHFIVVVDGIVIGSRSTDRPYPWAVRHQGAVGPFATFHQTLVHAEYSARTFFGGKGVVVPTLETQTRLAVGARVGEVH